MALEAEIVIRLGGDALLCLRLAFRCTFFAFDFMLPALGFVLLALGFMLLAFGIVVWLAFGFMFLALGFGGVLVGNIFLNAVVWRANSLTNRHPVISWPMRFVPDEKP